MQIDTLGFVWASFMTSSLLLLGGQEGVSAKLCCSAGGVQRHHCSASGVWSVTVVMPTVSG